MLLAVSLLPFFFAVAPAADAQTIMATLRGTVVDEQGAIVPGVAITARHRETNTTRSTVTADLGQFFLPGLPAGTYEVAATLKGFMPAAQTLEFTVGAELTMDFILRVSSVAESIMVTGEAPLLERTRATVGMTITKAQVDTLPTLNRDFLSLAQLAPGVSSGVGSNGASLAVNGQRGYQNDVLVDGVSNQWQYYGRQASTFSQDWIQEFRVMTNSYAAEFGNASGGVLNVITRSGSNRYQGRAYVFYREKAFDSRPFAGRFENDDVSKPVFVPKGDVPDYTQRRWGGTLGGPILKNRLFFFTGYEDLLRESNDFLSISEYWKAQGYHSVEPVKNTDHPFMVKGDLNLTDRHRLSVRYDRTVNKDINHGDPWTPYEGRSSFGGPVWDVVGNLTSAFGNTQVNEFRGSFMSNMPPGICNASGSAGMANLAKAPPGTYSAQVYPSLEIGCFPSGLEGEENLGLMDNFTVVRGPHQIKVGGQAMRNRMIVDITNWHEGLWVFSEDRVFDRTQSTTYPVFFVGNTGRRAFQSQTWKYDLFVQDTWQVRNDVTLTLGLRYDVDRGATAGNQFVDEKNAKVVRTLGGSPPLVKATVDYDNVSPRLGVVWTPNDDKRTTLRGAFGVFYDQTHGNFNAIYISNSLLSDGFTIIDCSSPTFNPFWSTADPGPAEAMCGGFLATNWPLFPDLSLAPTAAQILNSLDPHFRTPHTTQYTAGLAHEFPKGLMVGLDVVYSRGSGITDVQKNLRLLSPTQAEVIDPRFSSMSQSTNVGWVHYTALQTQAHYRSRPLNLGVSYTLSQADSNLTSGSIFGSAPTNPFDLDVDKGPDDTDTRHNFVLNGAAAFPYGFQLSGIWVFRSARPWSPWTNDNPENLVYPLWPEGKNSRRGDSEKTVDLRVGKTLRFGPQVSTTIFWEMFNTFNWQNYYAYDSLLGSPTFGMPTAARDLRRQQLGVRLDF